ncbi:MAG: ABC transporter substrate-binding protein, partial [Desulfovibrionaceae bacterium]
MRRAFIALCLLCVLTPLAGLAHAQSLRIGILPVLDTLPLQAAVRDGLFEQRGLDVELVPFASALERNTAMAGGQLDGCFTDLVDVLLFLRNKAPLRVVTVSYRTTPGQPMFGLVTSPGRAGRSIESLQAHAVAISKATIIEYVLDSMLRQAELPQSYFQRVEIKKIPIRLQMLLTDEAALSVLPEPLLALARFKGGDTLMTDENLGIPLTVVCLKQGPAMDPEVREPFLAAYAEAVRRINERPGDYRGLMVETCRIPGPLAADFPVYRYPAPALPSRVAV